MIVWGAPIILSIIRGVMKTSVNLIRCPRHVYIPEATSPKCRKILLRNHSTARKHFRKYLQLSSGNRNLTCFGFYRNNDVGAISISQTYYTARHTVNELIRLAVCELWYWDWKHEIIFQHSISYLPGTDVLKRKIASLWCHTIPNSSQITRVWLFIEKFV